MGIPNELFYGQDTYTLKVQMQTGLAQCPERHHLMSIDYRALTLEGLSSTLCQQCGATVTSGSEICFICNYYN